MRSDMSKVIVERPRWNHEDSFRSVRGSVRFRAHEDPDDYVHPQHVYARGNAKTLNENLNPLLRWLRKQVGRPWRLVYAELSEHVDRDSAVQAHIHQHVKQWVIEYGDHRYDKQWYHNRDDFRVDQHGILRLAKTKPRPRRQPEQDVIKLDDFTYYERHHGLWYLCEYAWVPGVTSCSGTMWHLPGRHYRNIVKLETGYTTYEWWRQVSKRALNTKEIARLPKAA